ncbi:hypothetical protein [Micromonospora sp. WMMD1082]|uniref:hypothetical protein n=1 Tax=Micromonospora sp. WMMD1082 TaxID=3016104 RepID=UPI002415B702|nr:hypothetical protein [Micromonospora sp. WMMD1082]MDG4795001.1 hypothetical protein [Micromonospora sp. WMMD1082]
MASTPADHADDHTSQVIQSRLLVIQSRLEYLFSGEREGAEPYTESEVARALIARGYPITEGGLRNLRRGEKINPKATTLIGLAEHFGVPPGFLLGEGDEPTLKAREARVLARTIQDLSPENRRKIAATIRDYQELEALKERASRPSPPDQ